MNEKRKIVLVGCGFVGMSMAYSFLNTGGIDELVLIDVDQEKAIGEAMDLQHGLPYARGKMSIRAGGYEECQDAAVVVITAGVTQKPTDPLGSYRKRYGNHQKCYRTNYVQRL